MKKKNKTWRASLRDELLFKTNLLGSSAGVRQPVGTDSGDGQWDGGREKRWNCQALPGKSHPRVAGGKMGWGRGAMGVPRDEEQLKPERQRLHPSNSSPSHPTPLQPPRWSVIPHPPSPKPNSSSLPSPSLSLLSCSLADLLRQRGEEFRRFKGCSVETACHVGATAAWPVDFTDSCCYNWSSGSSTLF